ncbi:protein kinase family protein [Streptomyces sp. NEAU-H3]|uniref:protein kinase family protein n=1 Tax=Streptomyces sp. NEAU-H3 TaxID=2720636 RepID=UPI00143A83DE|nr:protein kinase family protein [Streptomyces sp. NEAU-H3]NJA55476.1 serine/threonine protein kinase [Streptomyces sp. NEAU-H3]
MAERSTSAVDVARESGEEPQTAPAEQATADAKAGAPERDTGHEDTEHSEEEKSEAEAAAAPPELHSGHKLARRYRLEECLTRLDGFSSWRAVDEKLRRAVGVHLLPTAHPRAREVLAAARSTALLSDPRFVQVLDAVEDDDLVYVVHEWLPDATELTALLAAGPLQAHEAYEMVRHVAQAMAAAHRAGLSHLRLNPGSVLRTSSGQYRIRGLAVNAALRGVTSEDPARTDTEAIGALLYASLTQRWPYEDDAYGLSGLPKGVGLLPPDQVRAGVHRGLSELAVRALANEGATASRQEPPCTTPAELAAAVDELPRIRPPEPAYTAPPEYQAPAFPQNPYGRPPAGPTPPQTPPAPPPPLQGRTGRALKWGVSGLLIVALGLGSWQLADTFLDKSPEKPKSDSPIEKGSGEKAAPTPKQLPVKDATEYYPDGTPQHTDQVGFTYDGKSDTYWRTKSYADGPDMNPAFKKGVGISYDLGTEKNLSRATIDMLYPGDHTTVTLYAADSLSSSASLSGMKKIAENTTSGSKLTIKAKKPVKARYVVMWITAMPYAAKDGFSGSGYKHRPTAPPTPSAAGPR